MIINVRKHPFNSKSLNDLDTMSLVTSMITVYCGIFFLTDKPEEWIKENPDYALGSLSLNEETILAMFCLIIISNSFFFLYWIFQFFLLLRSKIRSEYQKLYVVLCLCNNKLRLEKELNIDLMKNEENLLKENITTSNYNFLLIFE